MTFTVIRDNELGNFGVQYGGGGSDGRAVWVDGGVDDRERINGDHPLRALYSEVGIQPQIEACGAATSTESWVHPFAVLVRQSLVTDLLSTKLRTHVLESSWRNRNCPARTLLRRVGAGWDARVRHLVAITISGDD